MLRLWGRICSETLSQPLAICWSSITILGLEPHRLHLVPCLHVVFSSSVCLCPYFHFSWWHQFLSIRCLLWWPHFNSVPPKDPNLQIRSYSEILHTRTSIQETGVQGHNPAHCITVCLLFQRITLLSSNNFLKTKDFWFLGGFKLRNLCFMGMFITASVMPMSFYGYVYDEFFIVNNYCLADWLAFNSESIIIN